MESPPNPCKKNRPYLNLLRSKHAKYEGIDNSTHSPVKPIYSTYFSDFEDNRFYPKILPRGNLSLVYIIYLGWRETTTGLSIHD